MAAPDDDGLPAIYTEPGVLRVAVVGCDYFAHRWATVDGLRTRLPVERITVASVDGDDVVTVNGERIPVLSLGGSPLPPRGRKIVAPLPPFQKVAFDVVRKLSGSRPRGAWHGLPLPGAVDDLDDAAWLTEAFRACGSIGPDNAVARVTKFEVLAVEGLNAAGGAGEKAFITVEYAKPDPKLHTHLFAKIPWSIAKQAPWRERISCGSDCDGKEISFYQFLGHACPFEVPVLYFADLDRASTDYVLITERFAFPPADTIANKFMMGHRGELEPAPPRAETDRRFRGPPRVLSTAFRIDLVSRVFLWDRPV